MTFRARWIVLSLGIIVTSRLPARAQNQAGSAVAASPEVTADYPRDRAGVLIQGSEWMSITVQGPSRTRTKHGLAPAVTYGIASAAVVSEYDGLHAAIKVQPGRPVICVCRMMAPPGGLALVRLHPKKTSRELDGGKLHIGSKIAEAEQNDLLPINITQPENNVWLVQPQQDLPAGEYALMAGTQNMAIFPFTVAGPPASPPPAGK
ncbi:MAG: hypothetical protein ABSF45_03590 [Terriglobia bacterium]